MGNERRKATLIMVFAVVFICLFFATAVFLLMRANKEKGMNQKEAVELFVKNTNSNIKSGLINIQEGVYDIESFDVSEMLFKPDFGWVKISNAEISEYSLYFLDSDQDINGKLKDGMYEINCCVKKIDGEIICESLSNNNVVNVKDYGAKGDISKYLQNPSELDVDTPPDLAVEPYQKASIIETNALQKAVQEVNKTGGILYFPHGTYCVSVNNFDAEYKNGQKHIFKFNSDKHIIVELGQSTIKQVGYLGTNVYNFPSVNMFMVENAESVEIRNGTLIGDRKDHDYSDWISSDLVDKHGVPYADTHEFGYGIFFYNTKNGIAKNLNIKEFTGDAVFIKNGAEAEKTGESFVTRIEDCELSYCRRQGISVGDSDISIVKNCLIHDIGDSELFDGDAGKGTDPMAGIDIEPASGSKKVKSFKIENTRIYDCIAGAIISSVEYLNNTVEVINSYIESPCIHGTVFKNSTLFFDYLPKGLDDYISLKCCEFENVDFKFENWSKRFLSLSYLTQHDVEVRGISTKKQVKINNCRFYTDVDENNESSRVSFSDCKEINNVSFENFIGYSDKNNNRLYGIHINTTKKQTVNSAQFKNCQLNVRCVDFKHGEFEDSLVYMVDQSGVQEVLLFDSITFANCNLDIRSTNDVLYKGCIFDECETRIEKNGRITIKYERCKGEPIKVEMFTASKKNN